MATEKHVVCGMTVDAEQARFRAALDGKTYYFCGPRCLERFKSEPKAFLQYTVWQERWPHERR